MSSSDDNKNNKKLILIQLHGDTNTVNGVRVLETRSLTDAGWSGRGTTFGGTYRGLVTVKHDVQWNLHALR